MYVFVPIRFMFRSQLIERIRSQLVPCGRTSFDLLIASTIHQRKKMTPAHLD